MKKRNSLEKLNFFPSFVGNNPKKILAVILLFTLVMGYFASNVQMGTEEESFNPESDKAEWLNEIQSDFGTTGEAVQIAFTADDGNVFTREVLMDMLETKRGLMENETVNKTLGSSSDVPSGISTLADTVLMTGQILMIQDHMLGFSPKSATIKSSLENQTEMFRALNDTFSYGEQLFESAQMNETVYSQSVIENTTRSLTAASKVMLDPTSWEALAPYQENLTNLIGVLSNSQIKLENKINKTENFTQDLDVNADHRLMPFRSLLEGMNGVLKRPSSQEDPNNAIQMTLSFFQIQDHLPEKSSEDSSSFEIPSPSLDLKDKKEKLSNMSDQEIKQTVYEAVTYDEDMMEEKVGSSVQSSKGNFTSAQTSIMRSLNILGNLNSTVNKINESLDPQQVQVLDGFQAFISSTNENMTKRHGMFSNINSRLDAAKNIPEYVSGIGKSLSISVSKDFNHPQDPSDVKAKSAIGLIRLNTTYPEEVRKEAQYEIIEISEDECDSSNPRVFASQVMMEQINDSANRSMNTLLPLAFIFVVVVLLLIYRSALETIISLLSLFFAIIWTFGVGVILDYSFNAMIIAVPILITGLVIDYGIHMVMRYREEREEGKRSKTSTMIAISTVGGALFLTTMTTAIGFLSNVFSNISMMRHFGILAAVGISSSFVLMVAFLPSVLQLVDSWRDKRKEDKDDSQNKVSKRLEEQGGDVVSSILATSTDASDKHPFLVLVVVFIITSAAMYGVFNIDTTFDIQDFLPEDKSQSQNIKYISSNFNISTSYAYILTEGDVASSEYLYAVNDTLDNTKDDSMLRTDGESTSTLSVIQKYGKAQPGSDNYNETIVTTFRKSDTNADDIPDSNVTELYDLLYTFKQSKSEIKNVVYRTEDGSYTKAVIKLKEDENKITSNIDNAEVMEEELIEDSKPLKEAGFSAKVTSSSIVGQDTTEALNETQINSLMATIIIVGILLTLVFYFVHKSKVLGIITTIPVTVVTLWIIGTMYVFGVPLNVMTVTITALTVGMGVDYSIHITHRFTEEKEEEDNLYDAMHDTVQNTGAALFGSAATTMGAFGILSLSSILPLAQFGYITAMAIGYSFLMAVFVLPSALMIWAKCCK